MLYNCRLCEKTFETLEEAIEHENVCLTNRKEQEQKEKILEEQEKKQKRIDELNKNINEYENIIKECEKKVQDSKNELLELEGFVVEKIPFEEACRIAEEIFKAFYH